MILNYKLTADRIIALKQCIEKGKTITKTTSIPTNSQIIQLIDWGRDAIDSLTIYVDQSTIHTIEDTEKFEGIGNYK